MQRRRRRSSSTARDALARAVRAGFRDGGALDAATGAAGWHSAADRTAAPSTPRPVRPAGTPPPTPTLRPIANADDEVWGQIAADTEGSLRPLLRPASLPAGLATVLDTRITGRVSHDAFTVEYAGRGMMLVIEAGPLSPPPGFEPGLAEQVTVRGQPGMLTVGDDRDLNVSSAVYWEEPGVWRPEGAQSARPEVFYLVRVQGLSAKELLALVEALQPWAPE